MKIVGHTMATPESSPEESIELFHRIGLDGIELVCQPGTTFDIDRPEEEIGRIVESAHSKQIEIVALTPYMWDINSPDPDVALAQIAGLESAIHLARRMGARYVRAYGGRESEDTDRAWAATVYALQQAGRVASTEGITVVVENHPGTMTVTGEATARMVQQVGLSSVRALFDPANVMYKSEEPWETTLEVQKEIIAYVHVKDYDMVRGERVACYVGNGVVPWNRILPALRDLGYDGYLSLEYERKWHPDQLPAAEEGLPPCASFVRKVLGQ
jgi:sugar phosphate isomerase/epimerase